MTPRRLRVRPLESGDIPAIVEYWTTATASDLERMGVDVAKLPSAAGLTSNLERLCGGGQDVTTAYSVWRVDDQSIGYASLKNIRRGDRAEIHLHMWSAGFRGQGLGDPLFALSALDFYERFALQQIVCEPSAGNAMPNRMLQRAGYPLLGTRMGASSELSRVCLLNIYDVRREIARSRASGSATDAART